ncbi:hypothetical protein QP027_08550 [Corynebacterium breve]|uniref:Uncharacterized protein n=1 Tax=Corynebacterium breve TaxID=3049799 RepID=A0ABY8VC07_9CORY|nr:hypothetical protein [Corynebacterium breve]WIM67171.1 hypothetical protein QP027_08550 [Corynebacterium breve]
MKRSTTTIALAGAIVAFIISLALLLGAIVYSSNSGTGNSTAADNTESTSVDPNSGETPAEATGADDSGSLGDFAEGPEAGDPEAEDVEEWERPDMPVLPPLPDQYRVESATPMEDPLRKYDLYNDSPDRVKLSSRPGYQEMVDHVSGRYLYYQGMIDDGSLWSLAPDGHTIDQSYNRSFWIVVSDYGTGIDTRTMNFDHPEESFESAATPEDADAAIQLMRDKIDEYERRFWAGEPLDTVIEITNGDGSIFSSNATYRPWRETHPEALQYRNEDGSLTGENPAA